jgi:hypothetical protein
VVFDLVILFRAVVTESTPVKRQLLILNRSRERSPKSTSRRSCGRGILRCFDASIAKAANHLAKPWRTYQ